MEAGKEEVIPASDLRREVTEMTKKISKILAILLAFTMFFMISVTAFADEETTAEEPVQEETVAEEEPEKEEEPAKKEEAPQQEPVKEEEPPKAEETKEEEPEEEPEADHSSDDDDELVEIEDDWGYVSPEVIEQHTPAHTPEFIHADDPDWKPEEENGTEETDGEQPEDETADAPVTVKVISTMKSDDEMNLAAVVSDPLQREYSYQWQVSEDGGKSYRDMDNATEAELDILLDETNVTNLWRVKVQVKNG